MNEPLLRIGEIAAMFNVSPKAIRLYDKKGILKPVKTDAATGYRYYSADQVQQINALLSLKALGFSLSEIKRLLAARMDCAQFAAALTRKRIAWEESAAVAQEKMDSIDKILDRISLSRDAQGMPDMTEEQRAWLLAKLVCVEDLHGRSLLGEVLWL